MKIAIDYHDCLSAYPNFFIDFIKNWGDQIYVITGTPKSERKNIEKELEKLGIYNYQDILMGYEYSKADMTIEHFDKMKKHKLILLKQHKIDIVFEDNPIYVDYFRNAGIVVFMPALSDNYIRECKNSDAYFTGHLQDGLFYATESVCPNCKFEPMVNVDGKHECEMCGYPNS